jgi:3-methyladenine DNA glycosylase AlkD
VTVCERVVKNPERFAQLGVGWVLRELSVVDRPRMLRFLSDHHAELSREGLRYAVEKLPPKLRAELLAR